LRAKAQGTFGFAEKFALICYLADKFMKINLPVMLNRVSQPMERLILHD
jgi:hypothetical protein